jgi:hypothetical protein
MNFPSVRAGRPSTASVPSRAVGPFLETGGVDRGLAPLAPPLAVPGLVGQPTFLGSPSRGLA